MEMANAKLSTKSVSMPKVFSGSKNCCVNLEITLMLFFRVPCQENTYPSSF